MAGKNNRKVKGIGFMEIKSYPKVNIGLYVSGKREDGFHNIMSIFQKIFSIYDLLNIEIEESDINSISVKGLEEFTEEKESTVYKAANLWLETQDKKYKVKIKVDKNIPVQTGLGMPSSNAACTLLALEEMAEKKLGLDSLIEIGSKIGSDVPFFMNSCEAAIVCSRGEIVKPIEARKDLQFELIFSVNKKVSTKTAYNQLDLRTKISKLPSEEDMLKMYYGKVLDWDFRNDFEIVNTRPDIKVDDDKKLMLTGSGSCWFTVS